jgi:ankyrin repeat protein
MSKVFLEKNSLNDWKRCFEDYEINNGCSNVDNFIKDKNYDEYLDEIIDYLMKNIYIKSLGHLMDLGHIPNQETLLFRAIIFENLDIVKYLLSRDDMDINYKLSNGRSPLHTSIEKSGSISSENLLIIKFLLTRNDLDVNSKDLNGNTPLHYAIFQERLDIVELLLDRDDININSTSNEGSTALVHAVDRHGQRYSNREFFLDIIKLLLSRDDIDVNIGRGYYRGNALVEAITNEDLVVIELLIKRKDLIIEDDGDFQGSIFKQAIRTGNLDMLKILLTRDDANINIKDKNGTTLLQFAIAIHREKLDIIKFLLSKNDLLINTKDNFGRTPLHQAVEIKNLDILKLLFKRNDLDVNIKNNRGMTILEIANKYEDKGYYKFLKNNIDRLRSLQKMNNNNSLISNKIKNCYNCNKKNPKYMTSFKGNHLVCSQECSDVLYKSLKKLTLN